MDIIVKHKADGPFFLDSMKLQLEVRSGVQKIKLSRTLSIRNIKLK